MSIDLLRNEIRRFLSVKEKEVLCITGKWGVGKTYSWKLFLKDARDKSKIALDRYSYVSLFGISSLDELKYAIFENTVPKNKIESGADSETFQKMLESSEVLGRKGAWWLITLTKLIPFLKYLDFSGAHRVFSLFIRNQIICIDDLDRKGKNLDVGDILGLISFLNEERGCKIALILNEDALYDGIPEENKKKEFRRYFEKVVDVSLKFDPTAEEAVQIALKEKTKINTLLSEHVIKLSISNIRIIRKIERLVKEIAPMLEQFDEQVLLKAVRSLTLLGWSVYASETAPSVDYLEEKNRYSDLLKKETIPEKEGAWNALLDVYGFFAMDDFDHVLLDAVQNGFFDSEAVKEKALKLDVTSKAMKSYEAFEQAWRTYHDSFADNQEEVIDTIYKSFVENVQYLSPGALNGTVWLFKELGRKDKANEIIRYYIENRKGNRTLFDLNNSLSHTQINDPDVINAFNDKYNSLKESGDTTELFLKIVEGHGWNNEDLITVSALPVNDYYRIFKSKNGDELRAIIDFCLQFNNVTNASPQMAEILKRAKEALKRVGQESPINALRVAKYGVIVDNQTSNK